MRRKKIRDRIQADARIRFKIGDLLRKLQVTLKGTGRWILFLCWSDRIRKCIAFSTPQWKVTC